MNNIDKLNNKQILDYLVKVSKVQNKLLKKLAQNADPKAEIKSLVNQLHAAYNTALQNPAKAGIGAEILRELDESARVIGLSIPKPFNEANKNIYINNINGVNNSQKLIESLNELQKFIESKGPTLRTVGFEKK